MAWETRKRGGSYYTRSRRVNGRVVREYVGRGPHAEAWAEIDAICSLEREIEQRETRERRARLNTAEQVIAFLCSASERQVFAAMADAGYHRHKSEWRRKRVTTQD